MKKTSLYSRSVRPRTPETSKVLPPREGPGTQAQPADTAPVLHTSRLARPLRFLARYERILLLALAVLLSVGIVYASLQLQPAARQITQGDLLKRAFDGAIDSKHEAAGRTACADRTGRVTILVGRLTFDEVPRSLEKFEHLAQRHAFRIPIE